MMRLLQAYLRLIEIPFDYALDRLDVEYDEWWYWIYDICVTLLILWVFAETFLWIRQTIRRLTEHKSLLEPAEREAVSQGDSPFTQSLDAARDLEATVGPLKKTKQFGRVAEIYQSLNRPAEAAQWFLKDGDDRRAAEEYARAGQTLKAAKLLSKTGDYLNAARFFSAEGEHAAAAEAYVKAGALRDAALSYAAAGEQEEALDAFWNYFKSAREPAATQLEAAQACLGLLRERADEETLETPHRKQLLHAVAMRFAHARQYAIAANLFRDAGDERRAEEARRRAAAQKRPQPKTPGTSGKR